MRGGLCRSWLRNSRAATRAIPVATQIRCRRSRNTTHPQKSAERRRSGAGGRTVDKGAALVTLPGPGNQRFAWLHSSFLFVPRARITPLASTAVPTTDLIRGARIVQTNYGLERRWRPSRSEACPGRCAAHRAVAEVASAAACDASPAATRRATRAPGPVVLPGAPTPIHARPRGSMSTRRRRERGRCAGRVAS